MLLDVRLGQLHGPDVYAQLCQRWGQSPPVILVTAERDGMLRTVIKRAGFKELFESSRSKADAVLATVPSAASHFALDALFERPVQAEVGELLLLPKEDKRWTSCMVVHGMGGSGKVGELVSVPGY